MANGSGSSILCLLATVAAGMASQMQAQFCATGVASAECCCQCDQLAALANAMKMIADGDQNKPDASKPAQPQAPQQPVAGQRR